MCIISTAQQARPKVMGQMDPRRAQFNRSSTLEITNSAALERPAGEVDDGGGAREYGAGAADSDDKDGSVVCSAAILCGEVKARREVLVRSAIFQRQRTVENLLVREGRVYFEAPWRPQDRYDFRPLRFLLYISLWFIAKFVPFSFLIR